MVNPLEDAFPGLTPGSYDVTSPRTRRYNCIAWAAGDTGNWWWPSLLVDEEFWPSGVAREETLDAFRQAFAAIGYQRCPDQNQEAGFEKIALFVDNAGIPKHAARQQSSGRWTSKLGVLEDIEHALEDLQGVEYGSVVLIMKRLLPA